MNLERDLECTCDVGSFATCPVCQDTEEAIRKANTPHQPVIQTQEQKQSARLKGDIGLASLALHYASLRK